ncbi:hypothetical protein [Phyllobacterium myrsinacearum]|uniref:Uncharacterized protein n=1 Tax=Phyllobacterium myrsinacearum TaxID=28101 RepID=A0A839EWJ3_9HYPH|nr:hypothetical protein [Phyllobacterium myrsinacearum]MBA8881676.1 hypothetical protein [Phyllobacterium myrsinacearum]
MTVLLYVFGFGLPIAALAIAMWESRGLIAKSNDLEARRKDLEKRLGEVRAKKLETLKVETPDVSARLSISKLLEELTSGQNSVRAAGLRNLDVTSHILAASRRRENNPIVYVFDYQGKPRTMPAGGMIPTPRLK